MTNEAISNDNDEILSARSIPELFSKISTRFPDQVTYSQAHIQSDGSRIWRSESYREVARKVYRLARYLSALGVKKGDRVAIISFTRPEWMIADLAILFAGATSVSVYHSVSPEETAYILFDAAVDVAFIENEEQLQKLKKISAEEIEIPGTEVRPATTSRIVLSRLISFEQVSPDSRVVQLENVLADSSISDEPLEPRSDNEVASLVYTSGTSGPPKGVVQTHRNHLVNVWQAARTALFAPVGDIFLFLPLAHSFARLIGYIGFLTPTVAKFPAVADRKSSVLNAPSILRDLREGRAEVVPMVPRIIEKLMIGVVERASQKSILGRLLRLTLWSHRMRYNALCESEAVPLLAGLTAALTAPIAKGVSKNLFGEGFKHVVSGGAKLAPEVNHFFQALGIAIYEGYGLTETCVATNVNRVGRNKVGSVGPCLDNLEIRIAEDGEILFRGENVARGYLNRPTLTAESWDKDGWFHTGDLGHLDAEQFLYIDGRKKDLIVTSGGKKVAPQNIEEKFCASALVSSAVIVGDGRPYCIALVAPERGEVSRWAAEKGITLPEKLSESTELRGEFNRLLESVNSQLSKFETIKQVGIIDDQLTVENGMLTPTFKVKRASIVKRYAALIDQLYSIRQGQ